MRKLKIISPGRSTQVFVKSAYQLQIPKNGPYEKSLGFVKSVLGITHKYPFLI